MKRTWALVGAVVLAVAGAVTGAQAQAPGTPGTADAQGRPGARMEQRLHLRGPQQGLGPGQGRGMGQGQGQGVMRGRGPQQGQGPQGAMRGRGPGGRGPRGDGPGGGLRGLNLTEQQQTQLKAIHEQTRQAIDNLLTPEQKAKRRGGR